MLDPAGAYRAMNGTYAMAGLKPEDVNVAEVHDCFTVMGAIGTAAPEGECGINTSGGLIAKGHPIGATGLQ